MSKPIIQIENVGKAYVLGQADLQHAMFRDAILGAIKAPYRRLKRLRQPARNDDLFWALRNVSLDVQQGDVVGVIGRNGSGKSTLLKILSRITEPTEGRASLRGRVASLLEVGTGFHPELTGRENVYLNGAILGMRKAEIDRKFDEIVAFAEIEKFLDTQVKRYSSGMYVRLAFAVAAHLEPEILIIDEVLAVGDAEFQRKCLGKMGEVTKRDGRTIFFVSHNMAAVRALCGVSLLLDKGRMVAVGPSGDVIDKYLTNDATRDTLERDLIRPEHAPIWMTSVCILAEGKPSSTLPVGDELTLEIHFAADPPIAHPQIGLVINSSDGARVVGANNRYQPSKSLERQTKSGSILCHLGRVPLVPGSYTVSLWLGDLGADYHVVEGALNFMVIQRDIWGLGRHPPADGTSLWWPTEFEMRPGT
jgi:lipopolysaccharide transport system ATP-binding protein